MKNVNKLSLQQKNEKSFHCAAFKEQRRRVKGTQEKRGYIVSEDDFY